MSVRRKEGMVVLTVAVDLNEMGLESAASEKQKVLQEFVGNIESQGLRVVSMTEQSGAFSRYAYHSDSGTDYTEVERGTIFTFICI